MLTNQYPNTEWLLEIARVGDAAMDGEGALVVRRGPRSRPEAITRTYPRGNGGRSARKIAAGQATRFQNQDFNSNYYVVSRDVAEVHVWSGADYLIASYAREGLEA